jgi:nitrate/nitrite transport system substrate-binding protein
LKEIGYGHGGESMTKESFFDGSVFDPTGDMEAYASSFAVKTLKG